MIKKEIIDSYIDLLRKFLLRNMFHKLHFLPSLIDNLIDSQNVNTQMDDFQRRLCTQTQQLNIIKSFYVSQMNPKKCIYNSQFNYHTSLVTPFRIDHGWGGGGVHGIFINKLPKSQYNIPISGVSH